MTDAITSFQFAPTAENIAAVFGSLTSESANERGYLWAEAADSWSFSDWRGLDSQLQVYRAAELVDESNFLARNWLPKTVAGRWFSGQSQLSWRRMLIGNEFVWRAVYLGSNSTLSTALVKSVEASDVVETTTDKFGLRCGESAEQFILWGQQSVNTPGEWVELSIPHRFRYPCQIAVDGQMPRLLALTAVRWADDIGHIHFLRYTGIKALAAIDLELADV